MDDNPRKDKLRSLLESKKKKLLADLRTSMREQRTEHARMSFELAQDDGDKSVEEHEQHVHSALQSRKSDLLDELDQALEKIADDSYGICEECGCEISFQRLEIQPTASYCVACQDELERLHKKDTLWNKELPSANDETYDYLPEE